MNKNRLFKNMFFLIAGILLYLFGASGLSAEDDTPIAGCALPVTSTDYSEKFVVDDFNISGVKLDDNGDLELDTQRKVLDPNNIEIPIDQQVSVAFLYENAGYQKTRFGWMYETDVLYDGSPDTDKIRWVYQDIDDNNTSGNGIINGSQNGITYDTGGETDVLADEVVLYELDADNNRVPITFPAGTKLVFVLDSSLNDSSGGVFYTKSEWNESFTRCKDRTIESFTRLIKLYKDAGELAPNSDCDAYNTKTVTETQTKTVTECVRGEWVWYYGKYKWVCYQEKTTTVTEDVDVEVPDPDNPIAQGWLDSNARTRLAGIGYNFAESSDNEVLYNVGYDESAVHAILAAPSNVDDAWILAFDDQRHDKGESVSDMDFNDLVFLIKRKTGGVVQLKNEDAISSGTGTDGSKAYFTKLEFEVYDGLPCEGDTSITYSYSVNFKKKADSGEYVDSEGNVIDQTKAGWEDKKVPIWHDIKNSQWEQVYSFTKNDDADLSQGQPNMTGVFDDAADKTDPNINLALSGWKPGTPPYTGRKAVIDMLSVGDIGRDLVWKATYDSSDETCVPIVYNVSIDTTVASHETFSRAQPIVLANVTYSGSYQTPDLTDSDWRKSLDLRGHFKAVQIYNPKTAQASNVDGTEIWDAGEVLSDRDLAAKPRTVYFPNITVPDKHTETLVAKADGTTKEFTGTLTNIYVMDATLVIEARTEDADGNITEIELDDTYSDDNLISSANATGTIDLYTGAYTLYFNDPPEADSAVTATYYSYSLASTALKALSTSETAASEKLLNIVEENISRTELIEWILGYDRAWRLGAVDHSAPAVITPPNIPASYYGSDFPESWKKAFYDPDDKHNTSAFYNAHEKRKTVVFVGSLGGMLHAFDGGEYRRGDNPKTDDIEEVRGYFEWSGDEPATAQYGSGEELWAYIPGNLMPKQKNNFSRGEDKAYVDASPSVGDVYIDGKWRTVLIFAQGVGGHAVTCLDVTDPSTPKFLWEYKDSALQYSKSSPAIGLIKDSEGGKKWACFLTSGKTDALSHPEIFMIDIATGTLIDGGIVLDAAGDSGLGGVCGGQPALIDTDEDGFIDRVYVGTDKGYMYRVTINAGYTDAVINSDERDSKRGIYAGAAVVAVEDELGTVRVFFGTGGDDDATAYIFYAYVDKGGTDVTLDWSYELPAGMRIYTSAFASAGLIYFGATSAITEDPCEAGGINTSTIYAFNYTLGENEKSPSLVAKVDLPTGSGRVTPLVDDNHLYVKTTNGSLLSYGGTGYNNGVEVAAQTTPAETSLQSWREVLDPSK